MSPKDPAGGVVSLRLSPVSIESREMLSGSCGASLLATARVFPSGDQAKGARRVGQFALGAAQRGDGENPAPVAPAGESDVAAVG